MSLPTGIILIWSGAVIDIPTGFVLCDGNNGTPNLQNRFVLGAGDSFAVDDTGGAATHTHAFTGDGHAHNFPADGDFAAGASFDSSTDIDFATGTTDAGSSMPEYYALAYIMKT